MSQPIPAGLRRLHILERVAIAARAVVEHRRQSRTPRALTRGNFYIDELAKVLEELEAITNEPCE